AAADGSRTVLPSRCRTSSASASDQLEIEITETVVSPSFVTNAFVLSGVKAMSFGLAPTGMLAMIWFVAVLITVTWLRKKSVAKAKRPSGVILIPYIAVSGVGMVVTVPWVAVSMTHTFPVPPWPLYFVR